jgi:hypothetical protein
MWTQTSLSLHHVWEDLLWRAVCIWQDDDVTEPVVLSLSGRCSAAGLESPAALLNAALCSLERELASRSDDPRGD